MYTVYINKSLKNGKKYVGYTSKSATERLVEHNRGCNKWARENKPFILIYSESHQTKEGAMAREKFLKSGQGRK
ncbi:GIY-YIG nuclease family protein [Patescibacteria group bacterium]|nr:GIY-YIG nuclease family protein [Patescibacteria group bacterium]MBU1075483.1 GIY-YIG nuclease family protein [Patescibacteria group bacterium]MBU1951588.1 GIY-YIG nuclease family protein [Patescibacteria group bacterium]MBU2236269.1 GIY-YIG nuclease family protein [Patescibacteria group bacterium]